MVKLKALFCFMMAFLWVFSLQAQDVAVAEESPLTQSSLIPDTLLDRVTAGDAEAALFIGKIFKDGLQNDYQTIEENPEKAQKWFLKAAEMGNVYGMYEVAQIYYRDKQWAEAERWFKKAADQGHDKSFYKLAYYSVYGLNTTPKDCHKAYELFEEAIIRGVKAAANDMAWMLSTLPAADCRNGHKALKTFADLESNLGQGRMPWTMLDTKAAVLAEIADFKGALELQSWIVAGYCNVSFSEADNYAEVLKQYKSEHAENADSRCEGFVNRLQTYVQRKPWREPMEMSDDNE